MLAMTLLCPAAQLHLEDQRLLQQWLAKADDIVTFMLHSTYRYTNLHKLLHAALTLQVHRSVHTSACCTVLADTQLCTHSGMLHSTYRYTSLYMLLHACQRDMS